MKKFWNKSAESADIFIYGDITTDRWSDSDVTAKSFVEDLKSYGEQAITVHINSGGGDVFAGLAISNAIKNHGNVTVSVDGLAASAASLIAMGGSKIVMAKNSLMMLHEPAVGLLGYFDAAELAKVQSSLAAVHGSLIATYATRIDSLKAEEMVKAETWLSAQEAVDLGLADEISGEVTLEVDDAKKILFVNKLSVDIKNYDVGKLRRAMEAKQMDEKNFFDKLKSVITDALTLKETSEPEPPQETSTPVDAAQIRQQELKRIRDLQAMKSDNAAVNALIELAIERGDTVDTISPYLNAVKKTSQPTADTVAEKIVAVIRDQMTSGAQDVSGGQEAPNEDDVKAARCKRIADIANEMIGGK